MRVGDPAGVPAGRQAQDLASCPSRCSGRRRPPSRSSLRQVEPLAAQDRPLVLRPAERVLADRAVRCGRPDGTARSAAPGCGRGPCRPRGPPSGRPISAATQPYGRTSPRGISSALRQTSARSRCGRAGRGRCGPGGRRRAAARWRSARRSGTRSTGRAGRPVRARWFASNVASSRRGLDGRHARARSRPRRAARSASRSGRRGRPGRPRPARSGARLAGAVTRRPASAASMGSIVGGHAVISSRSCRWAASNTVRNRRGRGGPAP